MTAPSASRAFQTIALALIDDPAVPARETMNDTKFEALVSSIQALGLLQAIVVKVTGDRFEVVAGHRRRLACLAAELETVPCMVIDGTAELTEAIKLHENARREDLNVAEEAIWFAGMLDSLAGGDVDRLAELVGESRQYVETRLLLLRGDPDVFAALKVGDINATVAAELNRFTDIGARRSHLEAAVSGGATGRMVREWRLAYERLVGARATLDGSHAAHVGGIEQPPESMLCCLLCEQSSDPHRMELVYLHSHCVQILERTLGVTLRGVFGTRAVLPPTPAPVEPAR